jgi:hypothetical protein
MGQHYLPQYYLKGFCAASGRSICVYDKKQIRKFQTQVKSIANVCEFYPPELEEYLAEEIEGPANQVLEKIRNRKHLTSVERVVLSRYIAVLWKRVPEGKVRLKNRVPAIAADLAKSLHRELDEAVAKNPTKGELASRRKGEIDEILRKFSVEPPSNIWHKVIPAESTPIMVSAIATMTWVFFTFDEDAVFLTSDNPVFFFAGLGIGNPDSELSFPISSHVTLWATREPAVPEGYFPTTKPIVREMNRRIASITTRYAFHSKDEHWILPFLSKKSWDLNRIQWAPSALG